MKKPIIHSSEIVHKNPWYQIRHDILTWPNNKPGHYFVTEFPDTVGIICIHEEKILTVNQYRHTIEKETIELPMGSLHPNEQPLEAAQRELREETGHQAAHWELLGSFFNLTGACRNLTHVFIASDLTACATAHDDSEDGMTSEWRDLADWRRLIRDGNITHGETLAAWTLWRERANSVS